MTETSRNFANYQQVAPADLMAMQADVTTSIDDIVFDTLIPGRGYSGFTASKTGPNQVTLTAGRLYVNGKVYALTTPTQIDLTPNLPAVNPRIAVIGVYGSETDTNVGPVNFLSPAESTPQAPVYRPQQVAQDHVRVASTTTSVGAENPNPATPTVDTSVLPVCFILLLPSGISVVTQYNGNEVPDLQDVANRVTALEAWEAQAKPQIASLASDIARLAGQLSAQTNAQTIGQILIRIADLDAQAGIPANATDSSTDYFLNLTSSDTTNLLYSAQVEEGIRFPDAAANDQALVQFNPLDPNAMVKNGFLFAAYDPAFRFNTGTVIGGLQISSFQYQVQAYEQVTVSRTRIRYGAEFDVCTNSAFWKSGQYDPISGIFTLPDGETFNAADTLTSYNNLGAQHEMIRLQEFWTDSYTDTYWGYQTVAGSITGYSVAESFLNGQDFWCESVDVSFWQLDVNGSVTLTLCETTSTAAPDLTSVLGAATLPVASLQPQGTPTHFQFPNPILLSAGKRYAFVLSTPGNHFVGYTTGSDFPQGTLFELSPSGYAQGDNTKHLALSVNACKFRLSTASLQFNNLQLAGGMTAIDILAPMVAPESANATFEIQIAGMWYPVDGSVIGLLHQGGAPNPNVPLRVTYAGSPDMMPAIDLLHSNVHVSRPALSFNHISLPMTPPAPTSHVVVNERLESFDPVHHTQACALLTGANYATSTPYSSTVDTMTDDGAIVRTYTFNLGAAVPAYKIQSSGTTDTALETFLVANRQRYNT